MSETIQPSVSSFVRTVALVGNPNTGKTTLFNALTGYRQRVGNYPRVTVEKRTGLLRHVADGASVELIDLPGAYSLSAQGDDETVLLDVLLGHLPGTPTPDAVVCVTDAANLGRNLFLATQVLELGKPVVVALNMMDVATKRGLTVDAEQLAVELGVAVVPIVANRQIGIDDLRQAIVTALSADRCNRCPDFPECVCAELDGLCASVAERSNGDVHAASRVEALQTLLDPGGYHEARLMRRCGRGLAEELAERRARIAVAGESIAEVEGRVRYAWIDGVVTRVVTRSRDARSSRTERADCVLTHPVAGLLVFLTLMGLCFQAIYDWAGPVMDTIDGACGVIGVSIGAFMAPGALRSLLADGVVAGVGAVLVFLPQILILFLFIAILEDCGYMARAAFLLDRWMSRLGLNGQAFIPLVSSFACAVPGILATRAIDDRRDRFVTILIAPLMSCSARLPVYVLLIGAFVPATPLAGGVLNLQAVTLLGMNVVGVVVAVVVAWLLKRFVFKGPPPSFLMELPSYRIPSPRTVLYRMYEQGKEFVVSAGTIIFACSIVVWALGYYPRPASVATDHDAQRSAVDAEYARQLATAAMSIGADVPGGTLADRPEVSAILREIDRLEGAFTTSVEAGGFEPGTERWTALRDEADAALAAIFARAGNAGEVARTVHEAAELRARRLDEVDRAQSGAYLRSSLLGRMGRWIEPIVRPLGWDWRIGTAVIASFPAREVIVATMGTIYNLGGDADEGSVGLRDKLRSAKWPDGTPVFNAAVALSIMVFFALCCQCISTLAAIRRETRSWAWPLVTFSYMTGLAYVGAWITYHVVSRLI